MLRPEGHQASAAPRPGSAERILVATFTGSVRDRRRDENALVRWADREPSAMVCENVHRVKTGINFDMVGN